MPGEAAARFDRPKRFLNDSLNDRDGAGKR